MNKLARCSFKCETTKIKLVKNGKKLILKPKLFLYDVKFYGILMLLNPIQDGRGRVQKGPPQTCFFPTTCTNVGISPQNFLTFSFNPFDRLV